MRAPVVIMGVAGSGKSTVGAGLAHVLEIPFCEGDDLHPPANVAKMAAAHPLDDSDRAPWLARINTWLHDHASGGVASCSALRRTYRDRLRRDLPVAPRFVLLDPPRAMLERRLLARKGHFMPPGLLDSQLATLERPTAEEGALCLSEDAAPDDLVRTIVEWLGAASPR